MTDTGTQPTDLERAVFRTVGYFHLFEYPLTAVEIWKWLYRPGSKYELTDVTSILNSSNWLKARLETQDGFYFISGQSDFVTTRHLRYNDAMRKFRRARRVTRWLAMIPGVLGVAVCNSLPWYNTTPESDIDFFVVVKPGTIWTARFLSVLPIKIFRLRPAETKTDPVCLSFYVTSEALSLNDIRIEDDIYMSYWVRSITPLFETDNIFSKFLQANDWARRDLPNSQLPDGQVMRKSFKLPTLRSLENRFKKLQLSRLPVSVKERMNKDTSIIVSDNMLKFHVDDRRESFRQRFREIMAV